MKRLCTVGIVFLALVTLMYAQGTAPIKIGIIGPLSGPSAEGGIAMQMGIQIAADEINAKGGVQVGSQKRKLQLLFEDAQSKPEMGVSLAEKLITFDKVDILLGDSVNSSVTLAVMELSPKYPILFSTVECVSDEIPKKVMADPNKFKRFWKPMFDSVAYGESIAQCVKDFADKGVIPFKNKTVAYIIEDTDYGRSNVTAAENVFATFGAKTVAMEAVPLGYTDFYPQLNKLKSLKPDVMVTCFTSLASGVAICKQIAETGVKIVNVGIAYPTKPGFLDQAGKYAEKLIWAPLLVDFDNNPKQKEFAAKIVAKYPNAIPAYDQVHAYDVIYALAQTIEKAGTLDGNKLAEAYSQLDYTGLIGRYVFNKDKHSIITGGNYYPIYLAQVQNGKSYIVWPLNKKSKDAIPQF
jgi:branched-chain amino acid transport system substrate-binding protein